MSNWDIQTVLLSMTITSSKIYNIWQIRQFKTSDSLDAYCTHLIKIHWLNDHALNHYKQPGHFLLFMFFTCRYLLGCMSINDILVKSEEHWVLEDGFFLLSKLFWKLINYNIQRGFKINNLPLFIELQKPNVNTYM